MSNENRTTVGNIGNYYGCLNVKEDGGRFYWSIEDYSGFTWEEIPEALYRALIEQEARSEAKRGAALSRIPQAPESDGGTDG